MKLNEGLRPGDLRGLVKKTISIDEYESKISDDGLVVGIMVEDKSPAQDLSRFIEKSAVELLDAEVSPGPDEDGNYWVFVEFMRDEKFINKLLDLLHDIEKVSGIRDWWMRIYHKKLSYKVSEENIRNFVRLEDKSVRKKAAESLVNYLTKSYANEIQLNENKLLLDGRIYDIISFGDADILYSAFSLGFKPVRLDESARSKIRLLENSLGPGWLIHQIGDYITCQISDSDKILLLKD